MSCLVTFLGVQSLLKNTRNQFLEKVNAKHIAGKVCHEEIISEEQETMIKQATSVTAANEILFTHLLQQATLSSLKELCSIMTSAKGYARMREFGQMLRDKVSFFGECTLL